VATEIAGLQKHQPTLTSTVPRTASLYPTQQFCQVAAARPAPPGFCEDRDDPAGRARGSWGRGRGWQKGRRANEQYLPRLGQAVDRRTASQSLAPARSWALVLCPAIWGPGQSGVCILTHAHCCSAGGYDSAVNCGYWIQPQGPGNSVGRDLLGPRLCSARPGWGWSLTLPQRHSGVKDGLCCEASSAPPRPVCPAILCLPTNSCLYHRTASGSLFADIH
jgi:hypothetical protein